LTLFAGMRLGAPHPSAAMHISSQLPHWGAALPGAFAFRH